MQNAGDILFRSTIELLEFLIQIFIYTFYYIPPSTCPSLMETIVLSSTIRMIFRVQHSPTLPLIHLLCQMSMVRVFTKKKLFIYKKCYINLIHMTMTDRSIKYIYLLKHLWNTISIIKDYRSTCFSIFLFIF
jgi:hypothetical protein